MKFPTGIIAIASIVCKTHASGHLRTSGAGKNTDPCDDHEGGFRVEASVHMKGQSDSRSLEERDETLASELHEQQKLEATIKKREKAKAPGDTAIPSYVMYPKKEQPTEPIPELAEPNSDFVVNIVGGDISDANEFPYFGTLPMYLNYPHLPADSIVWRRGDSSLTCRSCS